MVPNFQTWRRLNQRRSNNMATSYIIASGKIAAGIMTMNIALPPVHRNDQLLIDLEHGAMLYEQGYSRSYCANQDEQAGYDAAAGLPVADGWLQHEIDYAAELEDLNEGMEDNIWHARGGW